MMQKIMKCGLVGGLILFIWGAVSWTVLPWQMRQFKQFGSERQVLSTIEDNAPQDGLYLAPFPGKGKSSSGVSVFVAVKTMGQTPQMFSHTIAALITKLVAACLVASFLCKARLEFHRAVKVLVGLGLLIGLMSTIPYVIWFGFPGTFAISCILESMLGWFFAGLAMGKIALKK